MEAHGARVAAMGVAIPASMLLALGFDPLLSILACLLANGVPTMFGSIGIPTTTLASITSLDAGRLAVTQALQVAPSTNRSRVSRAWSTSMRETPAPP